MLFTYLANASSPKTTKAKELVVVLNETFHLKPVVLQLATKFLQVVFL